MGFSLASAKIIIILNILQEKREKSLFFYQNGKIVGQNNLQSVKFYYICNRYELRNKILRL